MLIFECPACKAKLRVPDEQAGKTIACPKCKATATAPTDPERTVDAITAEPTVSLPAVATAAAADDAPPRKKSGKRARDDDDDDDDHDRDDDRPRRRRKSGSDAGAVAAGFGIGAVLMIVFGGLGCCAVVSILIALLVPAVQKVREAAARTQSTNNLKMIGLGALSYHDMHKKLPFNGNRPAVGGDANSGSWAFQILPFVDQAPAFQAADRGMPMAVFLCPGRGRPPVETTNGGGAWSDYFYNNYLNDPMTASVSNAPDARRSLMSITDGTSNTVFAGHGNISTTQYGLSGNVTLSMNIFNGGTAGTMRAGNNGKTNPTGAALMRDSMNAPAVGSWGGPFPQGGLMVMCDCTVRMFPYSMGTPGPFLTPQGGEPVAVPDF